MTCFECGNDALLASVVALTGTRHGESFTVTLQGLKCAECGFQTVDSEQSAEFTKLVSDEYRLAHGLLTAKEIRARRFQLGMTQQEFSNYLGPGIASVKRWEAGQIQDKAMDELIRLKTDPAEARRNLRALEQQQVPEELVLSEGEEISLTLTMGQRTHYGHRAAMRLENVSIADQDGLSADACIAA